MCVVSHSKNGKPLGVAFVIPPELRRAALYPAATVENAELHFNFGSTPFRFPPPVRYIRRCAQWLQLQWMCHCIRQIWGAGPLRC